VLDELDILGRLLLFDVRQPVGQRLMIATALATFDRAFFFGSRAPGTWSGTECGIIAEVSAYPCRPSMMSDRT
jgi:hypothetical protein